MGTKVHPKSLKGSPVAPPVRPWCPRSLKREKMVAKGTERGARGSQNGAEKVSKKASIPSCFSNIFCENIEGRIPKNKKMDAKNV